MTIFILGEVLMFGGRLFQRVILRGKYENLKFSAADQLDSIS